MQVYCDNFEWRLWLFEMWVIILYVDVDDGCNSYVELIHLVFDIHIIHN